MQLIFKTTALVFFILVLAACGNSSKESRSELTDKKVQLEKLKKQQDDLNKQVNTLQDEIAKLDTSEANKEKAKLVQVTTLTTGSFVHYIDLQGKIDAMNIAYVTPRGQGGIVKAIYVKQGDNVKKGQLLLRLDDGLAGKQVEQLQTQLAYLKDIYQRQQNLWKQNIGTEVQLLTAKSNVDNMEHQIATAKEQLSYSNVYAEMSGVADMVNIKVGEMFSPASAASMGIRLVNTGDLKIVTQVPENYLDRVKKGGDLLITLPELPNDTIHTKISVTGKSIDPNSRSFYIEARIPSGKTLRPNQLALVRIKDYVSPHVITVPVNTLQTDDKGKFIMIAVKEKDKLVARKKAVTVGEFYNDRLEVKSGLNEGDAVITDGFQSLYEGQLITTEDK